MAHHRYVIAIMLCLAFSVGSASAQDEKPSLWQKLRKGGQKSRQEPLDRTGPLATLSRKLSQAKTERQDAARQGADPADLHRMDARIAGIEELADLLIKRQEFVRQGRPRPDLAQLDQRIIEVRQNLRRVARTAPPTQGARFDPAHRQDLWSAPRGTRATRGYEDGALRRSMGI